jgi:serine/threonine-protein kinase RsbW
MDTNSTYENIELSLPVNAAYVSAARLTASSISYRMGFSIDEIEDIKAAVSEACTYIIKKSTLASKNSFKITFCLKDKVLEIDINLLENISFTATEDEMSIIMINALVDSLELFHTEDLLSSIKIIKNHKENSFDIMEG